MNVGFALLTLFPERVGGTETYVRNMLDEFGDGHGPEQVTVLANRLVEAAYAHRVRGPVSLHRVRSYRAGDSMPTRALAMAAAAMAPRLIARDVPRDIDVLHHAVTVPIPRIDRPTVMTIHEIQQHDRPDAVARAERLYRRWAYDGSATRATRVIAITRYLKARLVEHLGIDPERIDVVHYGVDLERFTSRPRSSDEEVLEGVGLLGRRFVVYPANLWPHKNHERLIEAFGMVADDDLELVLAGQTYGRFDALRDAARRAGVADRVRHIGFMTPTGLPALYRHAAAMVFPSLYEGFGAPPLEAMACGCPVVSSTRASLEEVCGDAALAIDPDDARDMAGAIDRATSDRDLRSRLREAGLARAATFSWRSAAEAHADVYRAAAGM